MPPFFAIHNIIPFFVFIAVVTFLLNYQSDTASSVTEFDRNILFARFIVFGLFAALIVRWRIYKAMPILVLGSHPHSSAYRMLVQSRELGRGDGGHKCGPPERRYPVAYRLFDERKIDSQQQQKQREGEAVIPPVAVYFPCRYGGASDDSNSREKIESINKKLFNCTMPWLPRNDIQSVAGISVRQNTPEFALYHWCDVKVRAKNVTPSSSSSSSSSSSMDINEKVKPISTIEDILCSEECPIILFSHGNCTNCNFYSDFCVELASRGAVVVVPWYMDGSSSGCLISDTSLQRELPKYESSPLKSKIVTSAKNTNVKNLFIHYIDTGGGISDETNSFVVSIRQEQLDERVKETENVANKLLANGMLFGRDMLGWFDDELKLRQCINRIRSSHGVSLMGHSFGGSTIFAVMANRLTLGDFSSSSCCKFRNYTCYDLWSLPIKKHLEKVENFLKIQEISKLSTRNKKKQNDDDDDEHVADSTSTPLPFLELQTSDEWSTFKDTHMAVIERIRSCWDPERYRFRIRRGTDHLSLCDAGMLTPRYFRHRDSKRRGLWTDDAIFICDSAIEAFETMKLQ